LNRVRTSFPIPDLTQILKEGVNQQEAIKEGEDFINSRKFHKTILQTIKRMALLGRHYFLRRVFIDSDLFQCIVYPPRPLEKISLFKFSYLHLYF
jgi:hypothetical protein